MSTIETNKVMRIQGLQRQIFQALAGIQELFQALEEMRRLATALHMNTHGYRGLVLEERINEPMWNNRERNRTKTQEVNAHLEGPQHKTTKQFLGHKAGQQTMETTTQGKTHMEPSEDKTPMAEEAKTIPEFRIHGVTTTVILLITKSQTLPSPKRHSIATAIR